jgi:hypothetical protein
LERRCPKGYRCQLRAIRRARAAEEEVVEEGEEEMGRKWQRAAMVEGRAERAGAGAVEREEVAVVGRRRKARSDSILYVHSFIHRNFDLLCCFTLDIFTLLHVPHTKHFTALMIGVGSVHYFL